MTLVAEYLDARRGEDAARLRRALALRALVAAGMSQRQIADVLGITQPAVSQQLKSCPALDDVHPQRLLEAAAPVLTALAADHGYANLAVFGSVARRQAHADSDIDLIVESPPGTSTFDFVAFKQLVEQVLGREIDLVDYAALTPTLDDDIRRDAVRL